MDETEDKKDSPLVQELKEKEAELLSKLKAVRKLIKKLQSNPDLESGFNLLR